MNFPEIQTQRLSLRDFRETDLSIFAEYRRDAALCYYQSWDTFNDAQVQAFWQDLKSSDFGQLNHWYQIAIADRQSDLMLGDCAVHFRSPEEVELGYTMPFALQGHGYMTEALQHLRTSLVERMGVRSLIAHTDVRNLPSMRLLERLGFNQEQVIERAGFYKGEWCDDAIYRWTFDSAQ
mgnify:CR=1 FL=1